MKWIKASERLPERSIGLDVFGVTNYGNKEIFAWDSMMQFFRPLNYEAEEMVEWLDEKAFLAGASFNSDAVEFAEWITDNQFTRYNYVWTSTKIHYSSEKYTTQEIYNLYKQIGQ